MMNAPPVTPGRAMPPRTFGVIAFIHNWSFFIVVPRLFHSYWTRDSRSRADF
jgi:hypothetical protein